MNHLHSTEGFLEQSEWDEFARSADTAKQKGEYRVGDPAEVRRNLDKKLASQHEAGTSIPDTVSHAPVVQLHPRQPLDTHQSN